MEIANTKTKATSRIHRNHSAKSELQEYFEENGMSDKIALLSDNLILANEIQKK